jgi:hypothetical protein
LHGKIKREKQRTARQSALGPSSGCLDNLYLEQVLVKQILGGIFGKPVLIC